MFQIIKTSGEELGFVDDVRYIKVGASGDYVQANINEATGVAVKGEPYKLDEVVIKEVDGGKIITEKQETNKLVMSDLMNMAVDHEYELTLMKLGVK